MECEEYDENNKQNKLKISCIRNAHVFVRNIPNFLYMRV